MQRILCVEDSAEVTLVVRATLGPVFELDHAPSLEEARRKLLQTEYDLILLDIMLPDGDGLRFCSEIKVVSRTREIPVIILTAKTSLGEKTLGFQLGIEDFITKPFEPVELRLRVESRLRKIQDQRRASENLVVGRLRINYPLQKASLAGPEGPAAIELSATEFKLLSFLASHHQQVKSREQIIAAVWGSGFHLSDRTIDSHISRIRKKIGDCGCAIEAVQGTGYRFVVKTTEKMAA